MNAGAEPIRLIVELTPGSAPVEGLVSGRRLEAAFIGWVELVAALEEVLEDRGRDPRQPGGRLEAVGAPAREEHR